MNLQSVLHAVFPPECLVCGARVETDFSICGACWADTPFIFGASCDACGTGLPGQEAGPEEILVCETCFEENPPWAAGRAVMQYGGLGRALILRLKYGDRSEVARAAAPWLARAGQAFWASNPVLVPIPLHWRRLTNRRYNQAALLAHALAKEVGLTAEPQALIRRRHTGSQEGKDRDGRYRNVSDALAPHPKYGAALRDQHVVLIDDVMTSGATFTAATEACHAAGAASVMVLALARADKGA